MSLWANKNYMEYAYEQTNILLNESMGQNYILRNMSIGQTYILWNEPMSKHIT